MIRHEDFENDAIGKQRLHSLIRQHKIIFGGNSKLKIYGLLNCSSGKRMLRKNRVFFHSEEEAIAHNFRPCGHCMKEQYRRWKYKAK